MSENFGILLMFRDQIWEAAKETTLSELGRNPRGMPWKPNEWSVGEKVMDHIKATDRSDAPNKSNGMRTEKYSLKLTMVIGNSHKSRFGGIKEVKAWWGEI